MPARFLQHGNDATAAKLRPLFSVRLLSLLAIVVLAEGAVRAKEVHNSIGSVAPKRLKGQARAEPPEEVLRQDIAGLLDLLRPSQQLTESSEAEDGAEYIRPPPTEEEEAELNGGWDKETWLLDSYRGPPRRTPVRLPETHDSYKERLGDLRKVGQERPRGKHYASADDLLTQGELGGAKAQPQVTPLFSSRIHEVGRSIADVTKETDLTFLGEERDMHKGIFDMAGRCGGVFLSPNIPGFHPKKVCLWRHWAGQFQKAHPTLSEAVDHGTLSTHNVLKLTFALPLALYIMGKALVAPPSTLMSFAWLVVRRTTHEIRKQQDRGEEVNVGRALNEVLRQQKELQDPSRTAFFLGAQHPHFCCAHLWAKNLANHFVQIFIYHIYG
ncbi:hypothetical protein ACSSS7_005401 [Eimeria intestinalis]